MTEILKRGFPGLKSVKDLPVVQDAPPPGGFPSIRIERRLPSTGPTGIAIFGILGAIMAYGFYQISERMDSKRLDAEEMLTIRRTVHPVLQAEWDLRYMEHRRKQLEEEARIMKDVPGWEVGTTTTRRWLPPVDNWAKRPLI